MTTRYRVEYALKGLLAVPFVLHSQPTSINEEQNGTCLTKIAATAQGRYAEILRDVEEMINDHIKQQKLGTLQRSKLKLLVPSVGVFFTPLQLEAAFLYQDNRRYISWRHFVPPSFNDIRLILNTAQVMSLVQTGPVKLITFDGDLTLYDDGMCLTPENPVIPRILHLLGKGTCVGIVTAAGYTDAERYHSRLYGLLDAVRASPTLTPAEQRNLVILGGETNFFFRFDPAAPHLLAGVPAHAWALDEMAAWTDADIAALLDVAEKALMGCVRNMRLPATLLRKERAVGIVPRQGCRLAREQLEETVLVAQRIVERSSAGKKLPFCAFNGGNDVFVDIGDKSLGVMCCQKFFGGIQGSESLHVGDQFLSAGANDFKARLACTTAWIAGPAETVGLLDELEWHMTQLQLQVEKEKERKRKDGVEATVEMEVEAKEKEMDTEGKKKKKKKRNDQGEDTHMKNHEKSPPGDQTGL
ncbi:MAG: IMP 5'-nucleotidase [Peltula sp. TS41687]|nr:MAG: IMP 5'-nucleotidase [Peltula sp. TS41687]